MDRKLIEDAEKLHDSLCKVTKEKFQEVIDESFFEVLAAMESALKRNPEGVFVEIFGQELIDLCKQTIASGTLLAELDDRKPEAFPPSGHPK